MWIEATAFAIALIMWFVTTSLIYGLFRMFKIRPRFKDALLIIGNYYYIETISTAILVFYYLTSSFTSPAIFLATPLVTLIFPAVSIVIGSVLLAYLFTKIYNTTFTRAFIVALISLILAYVIYILINIGFSMAG
jgi:hypothetical protein